MLDVPYDFFGSRTGNGFQQKLVIYDYGIAEEISLTKQFASEIHANGNQVAEANCNPTH